ncbi:hypothetical protein BO94DRAFT_489862 [Aspergillus sclerotioniger CBS 115572]|uniref:F-box domain-containing protein n=1 Tax=Aspergillus sclerotioniger CBS 115572 TaxID=1450535 RepID=A0A317X0E5_9EURO|nr:hypothetical protein BO94DRAFT_489862 [Aspergillus sclerotioniger CBS 115572]PWY90448.1 hypothetical protein BO94DRAFT_489862 [Aspergillus sclerotioniger CBS 115572]
MNRLPDEILLLIVDNIYLHRDKRNFLLVCRRWRSVLYKSVNRNVWINGGCIRPLVLAIHDNPALGSAIQSLRLHWWSSYTRKAENHDITPVIPLVAQISQSEEETKEWEEALKEGNQDAWLGLLLLSLENLIELDMHYTWNPIFLRRVISRAAMREYPLDTKPVLQRLEAFYVDASDDNKAYFPSVEFLPFFRLPSMRTVSLDSVVESLHREIDHPAFKASRGTSPIVSLAFDRHSNGSKGMAEFITSCANLEQFEYSHSNQAIWGEQYISFRPRAFYTALCSQKHSLQVIHLDDTDELTGAESDEEDPNDLPDNWLGSFADFNKLWDLQVSVANLLNFHKSDQVPRVSSLKEILPRSLKRLHLGRFQISQLDLVRSNLLEVVACREEFPHLEQLELETGFKQLIQQESGPPLTIKQALAPLIDACEDVGIKMTIVRW